MLRETERLSLQSSVEAAMLSEGTLWRGIPTTDASGGQHIGAPAPVGDAGPVRVVPQRGVPTVGVVGQVVSEVQLYVALVPRSWDAQVGDELHVDDCVYRLVAPILNVASACFSCVLKARD